MATPGGGGGGGGGGNITNQPTTKGLQGPTPPTKPATYMCDICGQEGLNEEDMKTHVLIEHVEGAISCPFCDLEGTTAEEMTLHVNTQHLDFSALLSEENEEVMKVDEDANRKDKLEDKEGSKTTQISGGGGGSESEENTRTVSCTLSNSKQKLNLINTEKQSGNSSVGDNKETSSSKDGSNNKESVLSYMPLHEVRNSSEVSMDTASSCQSNQSSTTCSPESEISLGNRDSSSGNDNSSSYEVSSSCSTTPEDPGGDQQQQIMHPREITIKVIHDSPKKIPSTELEADFKMDTSGGGLFDGEEQSRKRAKLYLHVPQPHSPRRQVSADAAGGASRSSYLLDSHASTAQLHRFVHVGAPRYPSQRILDDVETEEEDDTPPEEDEAAAGEDTFTCPLCSWNTHSPGAIVRHVNTDHLDIISPSAHPHGSGAASGSATPGPSPHPPASVVQAPSTASRPAARPLAPHTDTENNILSAVAMVKAGTSSSSCNSSPQFACPICNLDAKTGSSLEIHVNSEHAELLSPAKPLQPQVTTPMSVDSNGSGLTCPMCGMQCADTNELTAHVDGHFSSEHTPDMEESDSQLAQELDRRERAALKLQEQKEFERLQDLYGMSNKGGSYKKQAEKTLERAVSNGQMTVAEYYTKKAEVQSSNSGGVDDGHSCTRDLIPKLKEYYRASSTNVSRVWLCSACDHYAGSYGDKGWGCGYRNLQMLLSCLAKSSTYQQVLFNGRPVIPSIPKIQRLIEAAWQKGFDLQGSEQLGGKVINTTKWIGATEIVATLSALKIKCQLCDFHAPTSKDGTHPRLFEWVKNYFHSSSDDGFRPPLYLQHQGHSRTIVGVEEQRDGSLRLLLFDPSCNRRQMQTFHEEINANLMRTIRRTLHSMRAKQYQIVAVVGILTDKEYEESKGIKSIPIP